uniref:Uncharacterized protein n=1 Tax=viral metagenome TaxID=1070528 RepID=A0A6M3XZZ5_9ZZZZ
MSMPFLEKLLKRGTTSTELSAQGTDAGEKLVAPGAAEYEELTRQGYSFHVTSTTATASVVALPTRAAGIAMSNADEDGGKSIIIDAIYAINIVGHGSLGQFGLICVLGQTDVAMVARTLIPRKNNGGGPSYDSIANVAAGGSTVLDAVTGVAIGWIPMGTSASQSVISLPGVVLWAPVDGRIIIPPGRAFGVNVIGNNATNTFNCGIVWHEKQLTLG